MVKVRREVTVGRGLTQRRYVFEELHHPVSSEELDEYRAGEAEFSGDPWGNQAAPIVEEARRTLEELRRNDDRTFEPHVDEGWYYQQLIDLGERLSRFVAEYEVASPALSCAMRFGALYAQLELKQLERIRRADATWAAHVNAGATSNRKRPLDDDHTLSIWAREFDTTGKKGLADKNTAEIISRTVRKQIAARTIRALRSGKR